MHGIHDLSFLKIFSTIPGLILKNGLGPMAMGALVHMPHLHGYQAINSRFKNQNRRKKEDVKTANSATWAWDIKYPHQKVTLVLVLRAEGRGAIIYI
jgi:hypothetical protein